MNFTSGQTVNYGIWGMIYKNGEYLFQVHSGLQVLLPSFQNDALAIPPFAQVDVIRILPIDKDGSTSPFTAKSFDFDSISPIRIGTSTDIAGFPGNNPNTAPSYQPNATVGLETYVLPAGGKPIIAWDVFRIEAGYSSLYVNNVVVA